MSDESPDPSKQTPPRLDYASKASADKPKFSVLRVLLLIFLVILGVGALIFGLCTLIVLYHS